MMKKSRLLVEHSFDFVLLALLSDLKEYKLAWLLNHLLDIRLVKENDVRLEFTNEQNLQISNYLFATEHSCLRLLVNRSVGEEVSRFLVPELKQFDYLLLFEGEGDAFDADEAEKLIKQDPSIQYVNRVEVSALQSKENLIF